MADEKVHSLFRHGTNIRDFQQANFSQKYNVFMRIRVGSSIPLLRKCADNDQDPAVQKAVGSSDPIDVMRKLREMKNAS